MPVETLNSLEEAPTQAGLSRLDIRRALRLWTIEGAVATAQGALTTGAFQTGFALYLGCSEAIFGVLAAIPAFAGLLQLFSSYFAQRYSERKPIVAWFSFASRLLWVPILLTPFVLPKPFWIGTFLILTLLSSALINVSNPLWTGWVSDLVPPDNRGRYFGQKNMYGGIVGMIVPIIGGLFLDAATKRHLMATPVAFAIIFGVATLFAFGSVACALRSPDIPGGGRSPGGQAVGQSLADVVREMLAYYATPFADRNFRRFMAFALGIVISQTIAGQFFTVYQLKPLALTYTALQLLAAVAGLASLAAMPFWGYLADKYGNKPILAISCFLVIFPPFQWLLTYYDGIPGLWMLDAHHHLHVSYTKLNIIALNIVSGVGWAGVGLTQFNMMLASAPAERRTVYVSAISAVSGLAGGAAPLLGGLILEALSHTAFPTHGPVRSNYHVLFIIAGITRILCLLLLRPVQEVGSSATRYVLGQLKATKPIGSFTSIQKLSRGSSAQTRQRAAEELGRLKTPVAVEELVKALDDVALPVRERAAQALGEIGDARAVLPLVRKLTDSASGITGVAATALGKIGHQSAFPSLAAAAQLGPVPRQLAAIEALGRLPDPRVSDLLSQFLDQSDSLLRVAALRALAEREDPASGPALAAQLQREQDPAALAVLADALGRLGEGPVAETLIAALEKTASPTVRREILNAVGSVTVGRDAFYPFLALDTYARDETVSKILMNVQRRYRARAARDSTPRAGRIAVRAKQALAAYVLGDLRECLEALAEVGRLRQGEDGEPSSAFSALLALEARAPHQTEPPGPDEILLAVFLARQITDA